MPRTPRPPPEPQTPLGPLPRGPARPRLLTDPYALWAEARQFKGFAAPRPKKMAALAWRHMSCIAELDAAELRAEGDWRQTLWDECRVHVPAAFQDVHLAKGALAYATVVVRTSAYYQLQEHRFVKRLALSLPRAGRSRHFESLASASGKGPFKGALAGAGGRPVLAIIDTGLPMLAADFAGRLRHIWDQDVGTREPGRRSPSRLAWPWHMPVDFGYGRELQDLDLQALHRRRHAAGLPVDEASLYAALLYPAKPGQGREARGDQPLAAWALPASTHGAQCAGVAAAPSMGSGADAAGQADLIFVQLPGETVSDSSGGGLATYALDALRYVVERTHPGAPLVVNLSYGAAAGPHNGTSILESAIAQLVESRPGMVIVVPAGNLHGEDGEPQADERRLHAQATLGPGESRSLTWFLPRGGEGDHYLELWPRGAAAHRLHVTLQSPDGQAVSAAPGACDFAVQGGVASFAAINCRQSPLGLAAQGTGKARPAAMALLAVAPDTTGGRWTVALRNDGDEPLPLHAWIERADPLFGRDSLQSHFSRDEAAASRACTLSTLANGESVVVAGGLAGTDPAAPVASYSAAGPALPPSRRLGPDFSACCEDSIAVPYRMVPGFPSGSWVAGNGTSLAAPAVARWVTNVLAGGAPPAGARQGRALIDWLLLQDPPAAPAPDSRRGRGL